MCVSKFRAVIVDLQRQHGGKAGSHPSQEYLSLSDTTSVSVEKLFALRSPFISFKEKRRDGKWAGIFRELPAKDSVPGAAL